MGLIDRISNFISRLTPPVEVTTEYDSAPARTPETNYSKMMERFRSAKSRREKIRVSRDMYENDPTVEGTINKFAKDVTNGYFWVEVESGPANAQKVIDKLIDRDGVFKAKIDDYVRLSQVDGDSFLEVVINGGFEIVKLSRKPTLEMNRNSDKKDNFLDPARAFYQCDEMFSFSPNDDNVVWYPEWQIIHARWKHDENKRYGKAQYSAATGAYKRLNEGNIDMAVRRKTRSAQRFHHVVEGDASDIEKYKRTNKIALDDPFAANIDFFSNKAGSITALQGDANLEQIGDVRYHLNTLHVATPVPVFLLGFGEELNRDVLGDQREEYNEYSIDSGAQWLENQIIIPVINLALLLKNIWPEDVKFNIYWHRNVKNDEQKQQESIETAQNKANALDKVIQVAARLKGVGVFSDEFIAKIVSNLVSEIDHEIDPAELMADIEAFLMSAMPDEFGRFNSDLGDQDKNQDITSESPANEIVKYKNGAGNGLVIMN